MFTTTVLLECLLIVGARILDVSLGTIRTIMVVQGRRRIAVNLRMAEPGPIAHVPIDHFDGLDTWEDLPPDGRCIKDMWF